MHEDGEKYTFEYIYTVDQNSGVTFNFISHLEISKFGLADDMGLYKCGNLEHYSSSISLDLLGEYWLLGREMIFVMDKFVRISVVHFKLTSDYTQYL